MIKYRPSPNHRQSKGTKEPKIPNDAETAPVFGGIPVCRRSSYLFWLQGKKIQRSDSALFGYIFLRRRKSNAHVRGHGQFRLLQET